jgi:thioredoxin
MISLDDKTFKKAIKKGLVLVDFGAAWCGPCQALAPVFEKASAKFPHVTFAKVDIDKAPKASDGIGAVPTLRLYRAGELVAELIGGLPPKALEAWIAKLAPAPAAHPLRAKAGAR